MSNVHGLNMTIRVSHMAGSLGRLSITLLLTYPSGCQLI